MNRRIRFGATLVAVFLFLPLTVAGADTITNSLVFSSNPAFNPTPGNDNGSTFEVLEVPVNGMATVNVTLVADAGGCDASVASPLVINVTTGLASTPLVTDLSGILGRPITAAAGTVGDPRSTVSPTQLTFTQCGVPQPLTVTGGPIVNKATSVSFGNATGLNPCQPGSTCALAGRFVVVTRDPDQSLPAVVSASTNWAMGTSLATMQPDITFALGTRPLVPLTGDWNGDGTETPGYFKTGTFFLSNSVNGSTVDATFPFGNAGGFPVAGDFNGDGVDDVAVVRSGTWEVRLSTGVVLTPFPFGPALNWPAVVPVAGNWDASPADGIGVYHLQSGPIGEWHLRQTPTPGPPELIINFGDPTRYPVVGDWNGDGIDGVGTKVMSGTEWALRNALFTGPPERVINFGTPNSLPLTWKKAQ